ncbi:hypothetical protein MLGJGCBP_00266 [Rhodococcus sp. T7]|nr:BTAD domain-containing putative transcriptional regulator [Rhodococcus opacus]KAF0956751.1 hypothetical protein MLGJGCBP_10159 [Rhodococcus sp. T7]KAF0966591.1 hypothetical protein MLGJGCBP_00266 [Rhodococcus sp. T7]UOT08353.1 SARP family transcriptional regulator [Rhodococcus opacus]
MAFLRPPQVRLGLLGGFELVVDGAQVDVAWSAQRVVAYLALGGRSQPRITVASALWLDVTEERAAANLRNALWKFRATRERVITTQTKKLGLAAHVTVDVTRVVEEARKLLDPGGSAGDSSECAVGATILDVLSRDLLPDWEDDWILFKREWLRQLRIHAIEALATQLRLSGRYAEAVEAGLSAVSADPLRESAQRALIEAHLAEGNVADARRQFVIFRRLLRDDLGVLPSHALSQLVGFTSADDLHSRG